MNLLRITVFFILAICASAVCAAPPAPQKWALLIGIDRYADRNHINDLASAGQDARAMKQTLMENAGVPEENISLLVSDDKTRDEVTARQPTRANILRELAALARRVQPGDTVFVCYSGHGMEIDGSPYLLPSDVDAVDEGTLRDTSIEAAKFRDRLKQVPAGLLILAFDMCRAAPLKAGRDGVAPPNLLTAAQAKGMDFALNVAPSAPKAIATLFSCSEGQRSYEWLDKRRSYFLYYFEQGLRGKAAGKDGAVRLNDLLAYLRASVPAAVQKSEKQEQTPRVEITGPVSAGSIVLAGKATAVAAKADAPAANVKDTRARIKLTLTPPDAVVFVDGQKRTANPVVLDIGDDKERQVEIGVSAEGYLPSVQTVTLTAGTLAPLEIALKRIITDPSEIGSSLPPPAPNIRTRVNPKDGAAMVYVPAGAFTMGNDRGNPDQNPMRVITLKGYWIYKYPVTVAQYRRFCNEAQYPFPETPPPWGWADNNPMTLVSMSDSIAYCRWAGARLPTEAEWEKAARGTDGRQYPWGNIYSDECCGSRLEKTPYPVGKYPKGASPYGAEDMVGNIWQRVTGYYDEKYYAIMPDHDPPGSQIVTDKRPIRGAWTGTPREETSLKHLLTTHRGIGGDTRWNESGFRCAAD